MISKYCFEYLQIILVQFSHLGFSGNITHLNLIEVSGIYCYLNRLEASDGTKS